MAKRSVINRMLLAMPLALFASIAGSAPETVKIEIGPYRLDVPEYNAYLNGNIIPWLRFMVGADDDSRSATLLFSNEELEASIPGYVIPKTVQGTAREDTIVGVTYLLDEEIERYKYHAKYMNSDFWYGSGGYEARVIEPFEGTSWYRVYLPSKRTWDVISAYPGSPDRSETHAPGFFIASCYQTTSASPKSCSVKLLAEDRRLLYDLGTIEENLDIRDEIKEYIDNRLDRWAEKIDD